MIDYLKRVLDQLLGRDLDYILAGFNKADRQLQRFVSNQVQTQEKNNLLKAELLSTVELIDEHNAASSESIDRAHRVRANIKALVA